MVVVVGAVIFVRGKGMSERGILGCRLRFFGEVSDDCEDVLSGGVAFPLYGRLRGGFL